MLKLPVAAQLYTVRDACQKNLAQALKQIAAIGYRAVELAGFHGHSPAILKQMTDDCGLTIISSHVNWALLEDNLDKVLADHAPLGCRHLAVPMPPRDRLRNAETWLKLTHTIEAMAVHCEAQNFTLSYHNHALEFEHKFDGQYALDLLFAHAPHVQSELDVYWIWKAGVDPALYLKQFAQRAPLLHLKDADQRDGSYAEVGSGQLDWSGIFAAAQAVGVQGFIVEQDTCKDSPFDCLRRSFEFLKTQGFA